MTDKKAKTVIGYFNSIVKESKHKPNKLWVDKGREFYNILMQTWLADNDILMYLIYNEGKPVVTERFTRILKRKIYKKMKTRNSCSYLDYLDRLVDEYNNTYHRSIGKSPIHADYSALTEEIETGYKTPKFEEGDRIKTTKLKNFLAKLTPKIGQEKYF